MQSKDLKSQVKLTAQSEAVGDKLKNNCPRCQGTGLIRTWYDIAESFKVTSECPQCRPSPDLQSLRSSGL